MDRGAESPLAVQVATGPDRELIEMGRIYGMSGWTLFRKVILPGALPGFFVGLRLSLTGAWLALIFAVLGTLFAGLATPTESAGMGVAAAILIGFIAGAGIVVRNSIILVDFIELRLRQGMPLADAVVDAGAVRFRPMALTAAAVIVGSAVILFDPIFQGLAVSLMAGEIASLLLSRMAVPVFCYMLRKRQGPLSCPQPLMEHTTEGEKI